MPFFGVPIRNGLPIGLGSVAGFGVQQFDPSQLFQGGTVAGAWYDPSDLSTMFTTDAGTTPVAMPGGGAAVSVGRMLDKSGNGNHAIAFNNTTARPELRARVNLLEYSEQFDNGYWTKNNAAVATTTATTDPLGGTTAEKLTPNNGALTNPTASVISSQTTETRTFSCYMKAAEYTKGFLRIGGNSGGTAPIAVYDLTGSGYVISSQGASVTASINTAGNGWYRCVINYLNGNGTSGTAYAPNIGATSDVYSVGTTDITVTANGTSGIYIWGADLRPANIGANVPAYQRIADANTYDTSGFPLYLRFDGVDDSMYTPANLNLSGTDKVSVFAGVRKLSASVRGMVVELSATAANQGTFNVCAPEATDDYSFTLTGNAGSPYYQPAGYAAPISNVVSCGYDFAGALRANEIAPRINGVLAQSGGAGAAAGTNTAFLSAPLFIGARNNASIWFQGHLHSLIIAGSAVSAGNISATEQWVAQRTGIAIP